MIPAASGIGSRLISITHMRTRATFDFFLTNSLTLAKLEVVTGVQDWVTPMTFMTLHIMKYSRSILYTNVLDTVRSRDVSSVITLTVGGRDPTSGGDLIAA